jgi:hypothetical protein
VAAAAAEPCQAPTGRRRHPRQGRRDRRASPRGVRPHAPREGRAAGFDRAARARRPEVGADAGLRVEGSRPGGRRQEGDPPPPGATGRLERPGPTSSQAEAARAGDACDLRADARGAPRPFAPPAGRRRRRPAVQACYRAAPKLPRGHPRGRGAGQAGRRGAASNGARPRRDAGGPGHDGSGAAVGDRCCGARGPDRALRPRGTQSARGRRRGGRRRRAPVRAAAAIRASSPSATACARPAEAAITSPPTSVGAASWRTARRAAGATSIRARTTRSSTTGLRWRTTASSTRPSDGRPTYTCPG